MKGNPFFIQERPGKDEKIFKLIKFRSMSEEKDKDGNTIIYSGKVITIDNKQFIENIQEGEEWERLKKIMKSMAKFSLEGEKNA